MADLSEAGMDGFIVNGIKWNPQPLRRDERSFAYPIECLPGVIGDAVREVADYTQAPVAMVAGCALSVVSAAIQTQYSVSRNERLRGPASLFFLTVAESGERKSSVDALFMKPIRDWEAGQRHEARQREAEYQRELAAWEKLEGDKGEPPARPGPTPTMLRGDDTSEALLKHLEQYPIAAVICAEAGVIFGSHAMKPEQVQRNLGQANALWDGGPILEGRIGRGETNIESARVTMGLMLQPSVMRNFMAKNDGLARGIGYFARFLFCHPDTTQGTRFYKEPPQMPGLDQFHLRVTLFLQVPAATDEWSRLISSHVQFDDGARDAWVAFYNEVEEYIGGDREYSGIRDVASKAPENAARIACCLHVFTMSNDVRINRSTMDAACSLMRWYLDEAVRFGRAHETTEEVRNAELLEEWLVRQSRELIRRKEEATITVNTIRQKGPNALRGGQRVDGAIELLSDLGRVRVRQSPGSKSRYVVVAPQVLAEWG